MTNRNSGLFVYWLSVLNTNNKYYGYLAPCARRQLIPLPLFLCLLQWRKKTSQSAPTSYAEITRSPVMKTLTMGTFLSIDRSVTFHSFPANPEIREKWVRVNHRKDFVPTHNSRICSLHFSVVWFLWHSYRQEQKQTEDCVWEASEVTPKRWCCTVCLSECSGLPLKASSYTQTDNEGNQ